jgi:hypothetical protein
LLVNSYTNSQCPLRTQAFVEWKEAWKEGVISISLKQDLGKELERKKKVLDAYTKDLEAHTKDLESSLREEREVI